MTYGLGLGTGSAMVWKALLCSPTASFSGYSLVPNGSQTQSGVISRGGTNVF